jgi:dihydroorotate dehydrogenase electron transfer subunit
MKVEFKPMVKQPATVLFNTKLAPGYYRVGLTCSQHYSQAKPGQFIMLRFAERLDPLLRRPFSIHNLITENGVTKGFELLYKVVGKATATLSRQKPGDIVDTLGPLGCGFSIPRDAKRIYVVAGGVGVAPMVFLVSYLHHKDTDLSNCQVFLGGRTKDELLCQDDFNKLGVSVIATTDDGSAGDQCLVTHPLEQAIDGGRPDIVFACGPMAMLACVVAITEKSRVPCQVSLETMMACGMGACLGCAVESRAAADGYLHACLDGPVFDADILKF